MKNVLNDTSILLSEMGFILHQLKRNLSQPLAKLVFLGFMLNSITMTVSPTIHKVEKTINVCSLFLNKNRPRITQVTEVIGILVSNLSGSRYGPLHDGVLEVDKINALKAARGDYKATITLSTQAKQDLA